MTASLEDYLEVIGNLTEKGLKPRVKDIADLLQISKPSVHMALHSLEQRGMIEHEPYGPIILTALGHMKCDIIRRKHAMLFDFLHHTLNVSEKNADADACAMEHILSDETCAAIERCMSKALPFVTDIPQK